MLIIVLINAVEAKYILKFFC